jgi:hypothetical protein
VFFPGTLRCIAVGCLTAVFVMAQGGTAPASVQVKTPILGYFYDSGSQQFQTLVGIPGSGFLGEAVAPGAKSAFTEISPAQDYALAILPGSHQLNRISFDDDTPTAEPVAGAMDGISSIAISPSGRAALVYSETLRKAQVFTGMRQSPSLLRELDWSSLPGPVGAMVIDDAGDLALVAAGGDTAALYAVSESSPPAMIYTAQSIASIAFLRHSRAALAAAPAEKQVIWIRDLAGVPSPMVLGSGLTAPRIVAASEDGSRALVVDGTSDIVAIPLSGTPPSRTSCSCEVSVMRRLRGRDVFLLTPSTRGPMTILDAGGAAARVLLVPSESAKATLSSKEKRN